MANDNEEIEIQGNVQHFDKLQQYLSDSCMFKHKKKLIDRYYVPSHRNFLETKPVEEWLRLREADGKQSITFKRWHYNHLAESLFADEYESGIESIESLRNIFQALDFQEVLVLEKIRSVWIAGEYEISVDEVEGIEPIVEIEYLGTKRSYDEIKADMISFLKKAGSGRIRVNYSGIPIMMLFPNEVKYVDF